jgi:iron complex outermembrane receptor protein
LTTFDAGTLVSSETVANLDLLRKIETTAVKALAFVIGTELRVENYQIHAGDEASYVDGNQDHPERGGKQAPGAQVFPGFRPSNEIDRSRDSAGVYAGLESEINKAIALDVGGRFESYSDFGQSVIGKIATRAKLGGGLCCARPAARGFCTVAQ